MKTMKGPGIFLAQFVGPDAPFNSLPTIAKWAADKGFVGVQIPTTEKSLFDLRLAAQLAFGAHFARHARDFRRERG